MAATASDITASSVVHARDGLLATALTDTESVMLNLDSGSYFGVESVARTIWDAISEPRSVSDVCAIVAAKYDTTDIQVEADTLDFLADLSQSGLISVAS